MKARSIRSSEFCLKSAAQSELLLEKRSVFLISQNHLKKSLYPRDSGGTTDEHYIVNPRLLHLGVAQSLFHGLQRVLEEILVQLFETGAGDRRVKVDAIQERVNLEVGLRGRRQGPFGALAGCPQSAERPFILRQVLLELPREFLGEVCHQTIVEVLAS